MSKTAPSLLPKPTPQPRRVGADNGPWPMHSAAASRAAEASALQDSPPRALMERAGLSLARLARALSPQARRVEVWCGPGNNGGDGWVAARLLHMAGTSVRVLQIGPPQRLPADAAEAHRLALAAEVPWSEGIAAAQAPDGAADLVIDALLGLGTSRAPAGELADAIALINARGAPVLAVDLPSGLHPDTGQPLGEPVVKADHTLALLTLKPGLFTARGRDLAGQTWFDPLGVSPSEAPTAMLLGAARQQPWPHAAHKGSRGDAWAVGGGPGMTGAVWLAGRAALAAGAGRVYVSTLADEAAIGLDAQRPELMHRTLALAKAQLLDSATVVCGCGGGEAVRETLPEILARAPRLVLDADALNHVAREHAFMRLLSGRAARHQRTVITPHPLEAARLLGCSSQAVQADRLTRAARLAALTQATVVLKGSGSIIASPGRLPCINPSGNAALATAGSGDVLAGWLGGLWAQQVEMAPHDIACTAVWQHGRAADIERPPAAGRTAPLLASDLIEALVRGA